MCTRVYVRPASAVLFQRRVSISLDPGFVLSPSQHTESPALSAVILRSSKPMDWQGTRGWLIRVYGFFPDGPSKDTPRSDKPVIMSWRSSESVPVKGLGSFWFRGRCERHERRRTEHRLSLINPHSTPSGLTTRHDGRMDQFRNVFQRNASTSYEGGLLPTSLELLDDFRRQAGGPLPRCEAQKAWAALQASC